MQADGTYQVGRISHIYSRYFRLPGSEHRKPLMAAGNRINCGLYFQSPPAFPHFCPLTAHRVLRQNLMGQNLYF